MVGRRRERGFRRNEGDEGEGALTRGLKGEEQARGWYTFLQTQQHGNAHIMPGCVDESWGG